MISLFHFLRPHWLWALIPFVVVLLLWYRREGKSRSWQNYCDAELLPFLIVGSEVGRSWQLMVVAGVAGLLTIIALAGPTWEQRSQPLFRSQSAMVIALDLSLSMEATDVRPNRLGRAKLKLRDILSHRKEGQTGLLIFAGEAFVVTPLTSDTATITAMLNSIGTNLIPTAAQGSHPERALVKSVELMQQAGMVHGDILLISDGTDSDCGEKCIDAASQVKKVGYRLSVISVGTREGAPIPTATGYLKDRNGTIVIPKLDDTGLKGMASSGGGIFTPLRGDDADINAILALAAGVTNQQMQSSDLESQQWYESGPWLLILLLPLAALFYRRGVLVLPLLIILTPKGEVMAAESIGDGLWTNDNQRAEQLLQAGRADEAAKLFHNRQWQAAAQYRAGHFDESEKLLEGEQDTTSQYNYANAQARQGKFPEAIKSYESVLKRDPNHEDARYNLELIKKKMAQQKKNKQQGKGKGDKQNNNKDGAGDKSQSSNGGGQGDKPKRDQDSSGKKNQSSSGTDGEKGDQQKGQQGEQADNKKGADGESSSTKSEQTKQKDKLKSKEGATKQNSVDGEKTPYSQQSVEKYNPKGDANEQWLRQIPDDPGGLLQRKFKYQYQQNYKDRERDVQPW